MIIRHIEGMWHRENRNMDKSRYINVKRKLIKRDISYVMGYLGRG